MTRCERRLRPQRPVSGPSERAVEGERHTDAIDDDYGWQAGVWSAAWHPGTWAILPTGPTERLRLAGEGFVCHRAIECAGWREAVELAGEVRERYYHLGLSTAVAGLSERG
jgi:hypothetical protein